MSQTQKHLIQAMLYPLIRDSSDGTPTPTPSRSYTSPSRQQAPTRRSFGPTQAIGLPAVPAASSIIQMQPMPPPVSTITDTIPDTTTIMTTTATTDTVVVTTQSIFAVLFDKRAFYLASYELLAAFTFSILAAGVRMHAGVADEFIGCAMGVIVVLMISQFGWSIGNPHTLILGMIFRRVHWVGVVLGLIAQVIGAALGSLIILAICPLSQLDNVVPIPSTAYSLWTLLMVDVIVTTVFVVAYMSAEQTSREPIRIVFVGLAMTLCSWIAYPFLRSGVNIWYHLVYATLTNRWDNWWVYYIGDSIALITSLVGTFIITRTNTPHSLWNEFSSPPKKQQIMMPQFKL